MAQPQVRVPEKVETPLSPILNALTAAGYSLREAQTMLGIVAVLRNPAATRAELSQRMGEYMSLSMRAAADVCRMADVWKSVAPRVSNPSRLSPEQARQISGTITSPPPHPTLDFIMDGIREMYRYFNSETVLQRAPRRGIQNQ